MNTALLLIALGFGYKIYAEASASAKKRTKRLGKIVGVIIMVIALAGAVCTTACKICYATGGNCRLMGYGYGSTGFFGKAGHTKPFCPLSWKSDGGKSNLSGSGTEVFGGNK